MRSRSAASGSGDIEVVVSSDLDAARRYVLERLAVASAPIVRFRPHQIAIAGGAEWYSSTMDAFDNLHRGARVSFASSFRRRDPQTDALLEQFSLDPANLDTRSASTRDVISLVAALRTQRNRLGVIFPLSRLHETHEQAFVRLAHERSRHGKSTIAIADYGSHAYNEAQLLTLLRAGIVEYQGPIGGIADLRVRLASLPNPLAAEQLLRERIRVLAGSRNSVTEFAELAADLIASIVGDRSFALALNGEFPALTPVIAVRGTRTFRDDSTVRAAASAVLASQEPTALKHFATRQLGTSGSAGSWLIIERSGHRPTTIPLTGLAEIEDGRRDIVRRQIEEHGSRAIVRTEAISALVGGVAHDLNNSLQSILGLIDLLEDAPLTDVDGDRVRTIRLVAGDSSAFVHRLLALSRASDITVEAVDLDLIIRDAVELAMRGSAQAAVIDVRRTAPRSHVVGNQTELRSVFLNLLLNAIHASRPGSRIVVDLSDGDEPEIVTARVIDQGHGIDESILPRVFEPFVSGHEGTMSMGLGLAVAHSVLVEFGAHLRVESTSPAGTTMRIDFPLLPADPSAGCPETSPDPGELPQGAGVLICDDNPNVLEVLGDLTASLGLVATLVTSGPACLAAYTRAPGSFAVVIVDEVMPGMAGEEVIARLVAIDPDVRTIWLSGYRPKDAALADAMGAGATVKLTKPVTRGQFADALRAALTEPSARARALIPPREVRSPRRPPR